MMRNGIGRSSPAARFGFRAIFLLLILLGATPSVLHSQAYYGSIVGNVTDSTGAAIVVAKVTATANATNVKFTTTTSGIGAFSLAQLAVGIYTVQITAPRFKEFTTTGVEVHVSTNTSVNATLTPGAVSENVTVQADTVQVETTSAAAGEVVTGAQVRELPLNGENFVGLTQLSPGVNAAASYDGQDKGLEGGVNFSVNGNPYTNNLFLVDGVNNNDVGSNRTILVYPAIDTIAEFKMIRNSFGAEYGQASGAIISITTKSGQNQFHGGFFYAGRNDALDANNWFNNEQNTGKAKLRRNDWGYNVSGPALKDRFFFWWNQEWNREIRGASFGSCVPTDAEAVGDFSFYGTGTNSWNGNDQCGAAIPGTTRVTSSGTQVNPGFPSWVGSPQKIGTPDAAGALIAQFYPSPNFNSNQTLVASDGYNWASPIANPLNWSEWNVRPDWDLNKSNRITARMTVDSWTNPAPNVGDSFWGESDFPTVQSSWSQPSKSVMAKLSSTISNSMVNDVEFGYGHNAIITALAGTRASIVPAIDKAYPTTFPSSLKEVDGFFGNWGGFNPYGSSEGEASFWNIAPYHNHEDLYTVQDNLSKVKGNHLLKAGVFWSNNIKDEDSGDGADRPGFPGSVYCAAGQTAPPAMPTAGTPACVNTNNSLANVLVPGTGASPQTFANISEGSQDITAQVKWHDYEFYVQDSWKIRRNLSIDYGFRWSFYREPFSNDNQWANWSLADWSAGEAQANPTDACNGLIVAAGTQPCAAANKLMNSLGVNLNLSGGTQGASAAIVPQNNHDIAPRVGISWDIFGNGKTALRLGGGQFYERELVGLAEGMEKGAPFSLTASSSRPLDSTVPLSGGGVSPNYGKEMRAVTPNAWQWNVTVEQEVARNTTLEVGYVGNTGVHLTSMEAFNPVPQSNWINAVLNSNGTGTNPYRPAFNFGGINGFAREGHASYNSLQTLFRSQVGPSTFQAAYTWSHSIGDVEEDNSSGTANQELPTVQGNDTLDKGNTNINRPNIFVANEVYYLPKFVKQNQLVQQTIGGWQVNSIFTAAHASSLSVFANGGYSNTVVTGVNASGSPVTSTQTISQLIGTGYNGNNRPLTTGMGCNSGEKANQILNASAFTLVGYTLGTVSSGAEHRGYCYGAPTTNWDAQLAKNWQIKEKYRVKFAMDFFDMLNHPNFNSNGLEGTGFAPSSIQCGPTITVAGQTTTAPCSASNPTISSNSAVTGFGAVTTLQTSRGNRELQYSLKFTF
jgi:hypothetical protein